jgi:tetratricopeptide (TPR) repeat protein
VFPTLGRFPAWLLLLWPLSTWANPYLEDGRALFAELRYAEAISKLEYARRVPTDSLQERVEILDLLGRSLVAEGQRARAEKIFEELLTLQPGFTYGPEVAPKIVEVFQAAQQRTLAERPVAIEPASVPTASTPVEKGSAFFRPAPLVSAGIAVAAAIVGGVLQGQAHASAARAQQAEWSDDGRRLRESAVATHRGSTVCFVVAGVAAVASAVLTFQF